MIRGRVDVQKMGGKGREEENLVKKEMTEKYGRY